MEVRLDLFAIAFIGLAAATACAESDSAADAGKKPGAPDAAPGANDAAPPDAYGADPEASTFTGEVTGTDARVAVIATKHRARLYFCGGDSTYTMLSRWVTADVAANGDVTPDANAMGWTIDATVGQASVTGNLNTGGDASYSFVAMPVERNTIGGLYEAVSPCGKVGVIVSQPTESDAPVAQGACIGNANTDIHQVNPVLPLKRGVDGSISVVVAGETDEISVVPAAAPAN